MSVVRAFGRALCDLLRGLFRVSERAPARDFAEALEARYRGSGRCC